MDCEDRTVRRKEPDAFSIAELGGTSLDLPPFQLVWGAIPDHLRPDVFMRRFIDPVLKLMPNDYQEEVRKRRGGTNAGIAEA